MNFKELNFESSLQEGLEAMGFNTPTPIQEQAIPIINDGHDIIACAQTGTGKTAAFLLPVINRIIKGNASNFNTLIIVPTRELAIQIDEAIQGFAYFTPISAMAIFGGGSGISFEQEKKALVKGANIIVATPGRLISHLNMGYVKADSLQHLILDEADRMLDMGFSEDLQKIIKHLPKKRQTLLFSATMPPKIRTLANAILYEPKQVNISISKPAEGVMQGAYVLYDNQKISLLKQLLANKKDLRSIIIFASTKDKVKELGKELPKLGLNAKTIHSDLTQDERNDVLRNFKNRSVQILIATDILSRGIDIDDIGLVVNFDVPGDAEDYIHRVGRTARADSTGIALTFINEKDQFNFKKIEDLIESEVKKIPLPPELGEAPAYEPSSKRKPQTGGNKKRFKRPHRPSK